MSAYPATGGTAKAPTSGMWPKGEPKSVRDAYDAKQNAKAGKGGKGGGKK